MGVRPPLPAPELNPPKISNLQNHKIVCAQNCAQIVPRISPHRQRMAAILPSPTARFVPTSCYSIGFCEANGADGPGIADRVCGAGPAGTVWTEGAFCMEEDPEDCDGATIVAGCLEETCAGCAVVCAAGTKVCDGVGLSCALADAEGVTGRDVAGEPPLCAVAGSGETISGKTAVFTTAGSSRSFTKSWPSTGRGTDKTYPGNPAGTWME
jgi:hypothetical protein